MRNTLIVLADYASDAEYRTIKGKAADGGLDQHRQLLSAAKELYERRGFKVEIVECDLAGYTEFLKRNHALNSPQNVAMYVNVKHGGLQDRDWKEAQHQNIEIL